MIADIRLLVPPGWVWTCGSLAARGDRGRGCRVRGPGVLADNQWARGHPGGDRSSTWAVLFLMLPYEERFV